MTVDILGNLAWNRLEEGRTSGDTFFMKLKQVKEVAASACPRFGVKRLDAFGSTARGTDRADSDVDLMVEFETSGDSLAHRFFGLLHFLEDALGCKVDLLTADGIKNPFFMDRVMREKILVYEG